MKVVAADDDALLAHFQRFLSKRNYVVNEAGCHVWQGTRNVTGYGLLNHRGKVYGAHRLSWQLANGPIPAGLFVMHKCDNPPCINPEHLMIGTAADNARDMAEKGRSVRGRQMPHRKYGPKPDPNEQYALDGRMYTGDSAKKAQANARARDYQKRRYAEDPEYREKMKASVRRWQKEHPDQLREWKRGMEERKRDITDPEWRMRRYERIQQQRERRARQEKREQLHVVGYTMSEIAALAGVNRSTVFRWIENGRLEATEPDGGGIIHVMPDVLFPFLATWHKHKHPRTQQRNSA